ncbi:hypothetical protein HK096_004793 [Nowakowskiella sp. JEL0078]|nr:hypothetical protein HK096_004793 [Nowakowskiella sp. JEL0078]
MSEVSNNNFAGHQLTPEPSNSESSIIEHIELADKGLPSSIGQTFPSKALPSPSETSSKEQSFLPPSIPDSQTCIPKPFVCRCAHNVEFPPIHQEIEINKTVFNRKAVDSLGRRAWTEDEDNILKTAVLHEGYGRWTEIAKIIKTRTPDACRKRWEKVLDPTIRKGPWTNSEDSILISLVESLGKGRWTRIAAQISGRTDKQCRQRWFEKLSTLESQNSLISGQSLSDYAGYQRSPRKHVAHDQRKLGSPLATPGIPTQYRPISNASRHPGFVQSHPYAVDPRVYYQSQSPHNYFQTQSNFIGVLPPFRDIYQPNYIYSASVGRSESVPESSQSSHKFITQYPLQRGMEVRYNHVDNHNSALHPLSVSYPIRIPIPSVDSKSSGGFILPPLRTETE